MSNDQLIIDNLDDQTSIIINKDFLVARWRLYWSWLIPMPSAYIWLTPGNIQLSSVQIAAHIKRLGNELLRHLFGDLFLVHTLRQLLGYYLIKIGIFIHITNSCQWHRYLQVPPKWPGEGSPNNYYFMCENWVSKFMLFLVSSYSPVSPVGDTHTQTTELELTAEEKNTPNLLQQKNR